MGKKRTGPTASAIKASHGGQSSLRSFYTTSYRSSHGNDDFEPRNIKPVGTGYQANFRPDIYYTHQLDNLDNVQLGRELKESYATSYVKQHRPYYTGSNGKDELPPTAIPRKSGFTQQAPITTSDSKVCAQARLGTMTGNVYKPLLRKLQQKKIRHLDDGSLIPATETNTCYLGKPSVRMCTFLKDVGFMEPSGFTHYHHFDPILYLDRNPFNGSTDGDRTQRPTGTSEHRCEFVRWPTMSGQEMNSGVQKRAKRDSGYSAETARPRFVHRRTADAFTRVDQIPPPVAGRIKKKDPCEYNNLTEGSERISVANCNFRGLQRAPKTPNQRLSRFSVGRKQLTGFSANNNGHVETADTKSRVISHYDVKFAPKLANYPGRAEVSGLTKQTNGFTKSTVVHTFGDGIPFRPTNLRVLHPHAAKVTKLEHPCYLDNTRNFKLRDPVGA